MKAQKVFKRNIKATLHRLNGKSTKIIWTRFFTSVTNAVTRGVELAILTGEPGDVLEISHSNFGFLIATVKLKVNAQNMSNLNVQFYLAHPVSE